MMFQVRSATIHDAPAWARMRQALWPEESASGHAAEIREFFAGRLRMPLEVLLAVDASGAPLGFVELSIRPYAEDCVADRVAYLEGWYVVPEARHRGIGRALVAAAEEWARAQGCTEFGSDALIDNETGAAAHRAPGFVETVQIRCFRKSLALVLALGVALGCTPAPGTWLQVWSDEFDGAAGTLIDGTKWRHDIGDGCQARNCGWGNDEKQYYTESPDNIALNGQGQLMIVARRAPSGRNCHYGPCRYTSAKVTTRGKMNVLPGRVEARIKLPAGQGLWPAFWMLGSGFPATPWPECGELDIMENRGSAPTTTSSAVHGPGYSGNTPFAHAHTLRRGTFSDHFHRFAVEWDSLRVRFFVDDTVHYAVTRGDVERFGKSIFDQPFFLLLNLAVGGTFDGDPKSDAIFPATMLVDYVRVYRRAGVD